MELSSNIHIGETLFTNDNNNTDELKARNNVSLEQLIGIKGLKTKQYILPELKMDTFDKTKQSFLSEPAKHKLNLTKSIFLEIKNKVDTTKMILFKLRE